MMLRPFIRFKPVYGTWVPADGSGAGLVITVTDARWAKLGRVFVGFMNITYPATADATVASISGFPFTDSSISVGTVISNSASNAHGTLLNGNALGFRNIANGQLTNANLSGAVVRATFIGMTA